MKQAICALNQLVEVDNLLEKDVWLASDVGLKPDATQGIYYLSFSKITTQWLKKAAMKFVRLQATTRTFSTCRGYIRSFNHLDDYLQTLQEPIPAHKFNRAVIVGFIHYLAQRKLAPMTRGITLINLRVFHGVVLQEGWLEWPERPLIFNGDLPSDATITPKYIPKDVLSQLKKHIHYLSDWMQQFIIILMETGRRISEICLLEFNCLEKDAENDFLLRVYEKKLRRVRLIPVSNKCVEAIKEQQQYHRDLYIQSPLLFPAQRESKSPTISAPHVNRALNRLAKDHNIVDCNGVIWKFSSHQFRHTIGTQMINSGVSQVMVQHYLGHESPEMTARYAHIHNETMKAAFVDYQEKLIDIQGSLKSSGDHLEARWLKKNIMTQALPNGLCSLPLTQQKCPHANACLTCTHFRTSKQHLNQHKSQLNETCKVIENAKQNGWQRIVEMNTEVACNLKKIITTLENSNEQ
jgi:integrase